MIKFVVVEDDIKIQQVIKKILRKISIQNDANFEIAYFTKYGEDLQKEIDSEIYRKVYIMDIELEDNISGVDIASMVRENDWESEIIFVTTHDKMFETVHRNILEVFDFIEKFQNFEERLEKDLIKIFNKKFDKKTFTVKSKNTDLEIYMNQILYVTKDDKKSTIHTKEANFKVSFTLEKMKEMLDNRFAQTHKSCIGNRERMMERNYSKGYFILDTGEKVDLLSKKFRKEVDSK